MGVLAAGFDEFGVRAVFDHFAVVEHHDAVEAGNRGQTMRHHDARAPAHKRFQRVLHQRFAFGVKRAGGLVKHQHGAVCQQRAGDGHTLTLPAGKLHAALARDGFEPLRQVLDELQRIG